MLVLLLFCGILMIQKGNVFIYRDTDCFPSETSKRQPILTMLKYP